jgi:hypothetical protein
MDIIADAGDYHQNSGRPLREHTMENNSSDDSGVEVESESSDYDIDHNGQKVKKYYASEEQRQFEKQKKTIHRMQTNIGQFYKENTIGDLLPYNQKLVVLNNEMTICQAIEAMIRQQNVKSAIIWNK